MNRYETAAFYGFTSSALTASDLAAIHDAGLDEDDAYGIECDIQCGAFESVSDAIDYYTARNQEG